MKRTVIYILALLLCTLFVAALPVSGEEGIYDGVIRLHVIAASDSEADQSLKLAVRDAILKEHGASLAEAKSLEEAEAEVLALDSAITATAERVIRDAGYAYTVSVLYGKEEYPTRAYGDYTLPAGTYRSVRVVIGEGRGQNWWCVLFPPLCLDMATETAPADDALSVGLSDGAISIITGNADDAGYQVRFKTLELLEGIFSRRGR